MKGIKKFDYSANLVLYIGFMLGLVAIYASKYDLRRQFIIVFLMIAFYLSWGFVFHHLRRDASKWLMYEYLLVGLIGLLASFLVFLL